MGVRISRSFWLLIAAQCSILGSLSAQGRPIALEDYYQLKDAGNPALSPVGSRIAYVVTSVLENENRRHNEIWLMQASGLGQPIRLTSPSFSASSPSWSPDGSLLVFTSQRPGPSEEMVSTTWLLNMDEPAGEAFQIEGLEGFPAFSPDGSWIAFAKPTSPTTTPNPAFVSDFEQQTVERFDGRVYDWMNYRFDRRGYLPDPRDPTATPPREIYLLAVSGGEATQLTDLGVDASGIAWSPDGDRLAFTADALSLIHI